MKKFTIIALVVLTLSLLTGCQSNAISAYGKNIISGGSNGAFDFSTSEDETVSAFSNLQSAWYLTTNGSTSSVFTVVDNGDAPNHLKIDTSSTGYANVQQKLYLKQYSYYKVEYEYITSAMSNYDENKSYLGLFVGFLENPDFNVNDEKPTIEDKAKTNGATATFYFKTENVREATLAINVGTADNPVSVSNVVIKDITLTRVRASEANDAAETLGLYTLYSTVFGESSQLNLVYIILGAIGTFIIAYVFYMMRSRSLGHEVLGTSNKLFTKINDSKATGLLIAVGLTLAVRLIIILSNAISAGSEAIKTVYLGYDLARYSAYGNFLSNHGPLYFLGSHPDSGLLPGATYIIGLAGLIGKGVALIPGMNDIRHVVAIATTLKLFAALADVGIVILIYLLIKKHQTKVSATIAASLYGLVPIVFFISSSVGSLESITAFLVFASFYCIVNKNYIGTAIFFFFACTVSPTAILAVPFVLMYTAFVIYASIKNKNKQWIAPLVAIASSFVLYYLMALPIYFDTIKTGVAFECFNAFLAISKGANVYSDNAFNFQGLIGNNFKPVSTESTFVTIFFIAFILLVLGAGYFKTKNRLTLVVLSSAFVLIYWYFCNNSKPNDLLIALPLLFVYTVMIKDKRLYAIFALLTSLFFVNSAYLYLMAGYSTSGVTQITYDMPLIYIMGSFFAVFIILFIIIAYDAIAAKKARSFFILRVPYFQYVSDVSKNVVIALRNFGYKTQGVLKLIFAKPGKSDSDNKTNK
ncbi:MAG: hypothetical protein LBF12_05555 [Christensenellaceae bacterium]|jgi:Gpi18-like mannosyltransferase/predicted small secreted protein|nr:hypothetical protein [Christensenellaceae bacterium]